MSKHLQKTCVYCGNLFTTNRKETETCSKRCAAFKCQPRGWVQCSICMATVGLGIKTAAKLIGKVSAGAVASAWQARGVKKQDPPDGSWTLYARRRGFQKTTGKVRWWGGDAEAALWRSNEKAAFPDWSPIWAKEKSKREMRKRYQAMTPQEKLEWNKKSSARNPKRRKAYLKKWKQVQRKTNPTYRIIEGMRSRLSGLVTGLRLGGAEGLVGCSVQDFKRHLESQFKRGMSWSNYGTHWHVDHIIPCAAFDHTDPRQVRQCWHFTNLRPLEAKANLAKSSKIEEPQLALML